MLANARSPESKKHVLTYCRKDEVTSRQAARLNVSFEQIT